MKDSARMQGKFKGVNNYCKTCIKECKQFENVTILQCPNRTNIKSMTPSTSKHAESGFVGANIGLKP
jgi:hypothetical protein